MACDNLIARACGLMFLLFCLLIVYLLPPHDRYNFLEKSVGLSSLFEISSDSLVDGASKTVETHLPLRVPGVEGLIIPNGTRGQVIRMIDRNVALVRWEVNFELLFSPLHFLFLRHSSVLLQPFVFFSSNLEICLN